MTVSDPVVILGDYEPCSVCNTPQIYDAHTYHSVCPHCGTVGDRCRFYYIPGQMEDGTYTPQQMTRLYDNGQRTLVGHPPPKGSHWSVSTPSLQRMRILNIDPGNKKDLHLFRAMPVIQSVTSLLGFSQRLLDRTMYLYIKAYNAFPITRIKAMATAVCYVVLREDDRPLQLMELLNQVSDVSPRLMRVFLNKFLKTTGHRLKPVNPIGVITRYGEELGLPFPLIRESIDLYDWSRRARVWGSETAWTIAAGCIYLTQPRITPHRRVFSHKRIGEVLGICEYSSRSATKTLRTALAKNPVED